MGRPNAAGTNQLWVEYSPAATRVLAAALELFANRGFHATTTREIAAKSGLSPAGVYSHFPSKANILYHISLRTHEFILARMRDAFREARDGRDRLRSVVETHVMFHAQMRVPARVANYELDALADRDRTKVLKLRHEMDAIMRQAISSGADAGAFSVADSRLAATALLSLGIDVSRWFSPTGRLSARELARHYSDYALRIVGAANKASPETRPRRPPRGRAQDEI